MHMHLAIYRKLKIHIMWTACEIATSWLWTLNKTTHERHKYPLHNYISNIYYMSHHIWLTYTCNHVTIFTFLSHKCTDTLGSQLGCKKICRSASKKLNHLSPGLGHFKFLRRLTEGRFDLSLCKQRLVIKYDFSKWWLKAERTKIKKVPTMHKNR